LLIVFEKGGFSSLLKISEVQNRMDAKVVLSLENITKRYPGVLALNNVSMSFLEGEVHALLGENGAGKSTLIKAVAGAIDIDSGIITINGLEYPKITPSLSRSLGVEVIYQEFNLVPALSVAENIYLCEKNENSILFSTKEIEKKAAEVLDKFGVNIDPKCQVQDLSIAEQQIVEIDHGRAFGSTERHRSGTDVQDH
jgi:ribose transport system ATP-binding protein